MHRTYNSFSPVDGGSATPSQVAIERVEEPLEQSKALTFSGINFCWIIYSTGMSILFL